MTFLNYSNTVYIYVKLSIASTSESYGYELRTWNTSIDLHLSEDVCLDRHVVGRHDGQLDPAAESRGSNREGLRHPTVSLIYQRDLW